MDVTFIRIDARRYLSRAIRDDGVTVQIPGYDNPAYLPHDLAHFLVEREYMPDGGFWPCVAAGAMFTGMVVSGRRRPHAAEQSKAVIRAEEKAGANAEILAGVFHRIAHKRLDETWPACEALLRREWRCRAAVRRDFTATDVRRVCEQLREAADRWAALPVGEGLTFRWERRGALLARRDGGWSTQRTLVHAAPSNSHNSFFGPAASKPPYSCTR